MGASFSSRVRFALALAGTTETALAKKWGCTLGAVSRAANENLHSKRINRLLHQFVDRELARHGINLERGHKERAAG